MHDNPSGTRLNPTRPSLLLMRQGVEVTSVGHGRTASFSFLSDVVLNGPACMDCQGAGVHDGHGVRAEPT